LGKELAKEVLGSDVDILNEAITLVCHDLNNNEAKHIRAAAAKIIEKVAEKKPDLVSKHLPLLFPALDVEEPQTRWMLMMTFGYCSAINSHEAVKAIDYAKAYIREQNGVCLSGAAELFLGNVGAISVEYSNKVYPILVEAYDSASMNEVDWIFEAFIMIARHLSNEQKKLVVECAKEHLDSSKSSTLKRVKKLLKIIE
jgi:hypothetical protein